MYQDRELLRGLLFLASLMASTAQANHCNSSSIWNCEDPYHLRYNEVPCNRKTCRWKIWKMNPQTRPSFCDDEHVVIKRRRQQIPDWQKPCLLWEILYGKLQVHVPTKVLPSSKPIMTGTPPLEPTASVQQVKTTLIPSKSPSKSPSALASQAEEESTPLLSSQQPSVKPSVKPSSKPSSKLLPSQQPSVKPSLKPTWKPVLYTPPESNPLLSAQQPSAKPSSKPTLKPASDDQNHELDQQQQNASPNGNGRDPETISYLPTSTFIEMKNVLVTFSVSNPESLRRGRALQVFDLETRSRLVNLTKNHLLNFVSELTDAQLRIVTYQEAQMSDGTWADIEAITGHVSLRDGVSITSDKLDYDISTAFKGDNLIQFMMSLVDDGDPALHRITDMSYGIPPGLLIFTSTQTKNPNTSAWRIGMPVTILSGLALLFLCGVFLVLRFARRTKKKGPSTPATKSSIDADGSPAKLDIPETILSVDGVYAVAVSELAAESIVGESDLASLYSYRSYSIRSPEKNSLSGSYDPTYCLDGKEDVSKVSLHVPNAEASRSEKVGDGSLSLKRAVKKTTATKTVPVNLYYAFEDNQSVSDKSNTSCLSSVTGLSNTSGLTNKDESTVDPYINSVTVVSSTNCQLQTKTTCTVSTFSPNMDGDTKSTETQNGGTRVSALEDVLSQVPKTSETSSRGESSSGPSGIASLSDEPMSRPKSRKVDQQSSRTTGGLLTSQIDYDNMDDESEGTSLFSGPEGSYLLNSGDDTSQSQLRRDAGPLSNALDDLKDDDDDDKLIEIQFFGETKHMESLEANPSEVVSEIPVVESNGASPLPDKFAFV